MSNKSKYTEAEAVKSLSRKKDISINGLTIRHATGAFSAKDVGIGSKGKIDFLTKYCGYRREYVS